MSHLSGPFQWDGVRPISLSVPAPNLLRCPRCQQTHEYRLRDFRPEQWPRPPIH